VTYVPRGTEAKAVIDAEAKAVIDAKPATGIAVRRVNLKTRALALW
jgi:hypothetical protein